MHCLRRAKWRGLAKVHIQFLMTAMAQNIKRMVQILVPKQKAANLAALGTAFYGFLLLSEAFQVEFGPIFAGQHHSNDLCRKLNAVFL